MVDELEPVIEINKLIYNIAYDWVYNIIKKRYALPPKHFEN